MRSAPDCRTRRALLHLSYSCAAPVLPAMLVTPDPIRTYRGQNWLPARFRARERAATKAFLRKASKSLAAHSADNHAGRLCGVSPCGVLAGSRWIAADRRDTVLAEVLEQLVDGTDGGKAAHCRDTRRQGVRKCGDRDRRHRAAAPHPQGTVRTAKSRRPRPNFVPAVWNAVLRA